MNLQTYGRHLIEVLAERSLQAIRGTSSDDVRRLFNGTPSQTGAFVGAAVGAFAIGAAVGVGLTALYTPTSGPQLRKKLSGEAREARKQAKTIGQSVRSGIEGARSTIADGVEQVSTSIGLSSPAPRRRKTTTKRKTTNGKRNAKRVTSVQARQAA